MDTHYLTPEEIGAKFKASKWTVRRWIEAGKLPALRIGRRWLVPADAVEQLEAERLCPDEVPHGRYEMIAICRGPAPKYGYFENPWTEPELERLSQTLISTMHTGGWPYDTWTLKPEGIKAILRGQEVAPPGIWRYLIDGIERLRVAAHADGKEQDLNIVIDESEESGNREQS
jgi:excisionase family DNA binding protein